jgi:adenylate cyclase
LISRYFDEATFGRDQDWKQVQHELRTPVNHIIGFSELLMDQATELGQRGLLADLTKIRNAAQQWLGLIESFLFGDRGGGTIASRRNRVSRKGAT